MVEIVLLRSKLADNQYQQKSKVWYTFRLIKFYAYLPKVEWGNLVFLKSYNKVRWNYHKFTDQNGRLLEMKAKLIWQNLLKNKNYMLSYRTKIKKICQRIRMFVICKKSILQILEKIIRYYY